MQIPRYLPLSDCIISIYLDDMGNADDNYILESSYNKRVLMMIMMMMMVRLLIMLMMMMMTMILMTNNQ